MTMPYYVAPEQVMKDRAEYAQKGIARGRAFVATIYDRGVLLVAENPSSTLHKISEIYDRIAFAGVGKFNEYDQLRVAGVRHADTKGYAYSREDVDARSLANLYAQYLGNVFTHEMKPMEVEILVAELGDGAAGTQLFRIAYEGTITDEVGFAVLGGDADAIRATVRRRTRGRTGRWPRRCAMPYGPSRARTAPWAPGISRSRCSPTSASRRTFRRLEDDEVARLLGRLIAPASAAAPLRSQSGWSTGSSGSRASSASPSRIAGNAA